MHASKDSNMMNSVQYPQNTWITGSIRQHRRRKVQEFNDVISCYLCHGYLINPTTIDSCMHSYCRSCIVQYLQNDKYCPQCKLGGGKHISYSNLKTDEALRCLVFKLIPGLYQQERERMLLFNDLLKSDDQTEAVVDEVDEEFFSSAEPISLSLEYHPALLTSCDKDEIPPVRYLQCPAGVMIHHLKRFLCSKYEIDPENSQVEIEVIYEEEVLPEDFTLMDVGYCYNWKRNGPMRFTYRILIHSDTTQDISEIQSNTETNTSSNKTTPESVKQPTSLTDGHSKSSRKTVHFADDKSHLGATNIDNSLPPPMTYTVFKSKAQEYRLGAQNNNNNNNSKSTKHTSLEKEFDESMLNDGNGPVKVIIARKPTEGKKNSPKRSHSLEESSYVVANDFKSLRSNDLRYSDYTVTSTTSSNSTSKSKQKAAKNVEPQNNQVSKCDIVVSIPQSQMSRSPNICDDNVTLSQLKTANKKSPTSSSSSKTRNVPKLKIELGSLKTKITIPKPKSADVCMAEPQHKKSKHRKYSMDGHEYGPTTDKIDLETYVKNIGLKPIEVVTVADPLETAEKDKYSPDASPMSSSSSTTSSSNGNFIFTSSSEITSSSHKKRKKKHSREDKKDSNGKRRKLHAEISSQPAEESLKMKVKITPSHIHKANKMESRRTNAAKAELSPENNSNNLDTSPKVVPIPKDLNNSNSEEERHKHNNNNNINTNSINISSLNKALSEESLNISNLIIGQNSPSSSDELPKIMTTIHSAANALTSSKSNEDLTLSPKPLLPKPLAHIKDLKIPSSPPLPPSLFKTTPLTLTTSTATSASAANKTSSNIVPLFASKPQPQKLTAKPPSPIQQQQQQQQSSHATNVTKNNNNLGKMPNFVVPNPPRSPKQCSLPASIASAAHKQMGAQLKRSASLDDSQPQNSPSKQQEKMMRKTLYGPSVMSIPVRSKESAAQKSKLSDKSFYSPMSSTYTHEVGKRKSQPMNIPPSSISVSKLNEAFSIYTNPRLSTQPALTITTHPKQTAAQQMINFLPYPPLNKPALEIVRITSNQVPADKMPLPPISPPKNIRPIQPPIPLLKIKKPGQQATGTSSVRSPPAAVSSSAALKTSSPLQQSPPALVNMRNTIPLSVPSKAAVTSASSKESFGKITDLTKSNGNMLQEKQKASLRDFRPTSKDGSVEILDLSATNKSQDTHKPSQVQTTIGNSLEAALNKIKQNITSCTATDSLQSSKLNATKTNNDDLQNLHLLSESATSREKIAIKPQQMLFEMSKTQQPSMVRHQNASVRNIPNPSALAFRNQPSLSMLASVASPPSPQQRPASPSNATDAKVTLSPPSLFVGSPKSPLATNQTSPRAKKHASIDQVAANLNIRAASAAAEAEAKAAFIEELSLVSSTSAAVVESKALPVTSASNSATGDAFSSMTISSTTAVSSPPTAPTKTPITASGVSAESAKILPTTIPTPSMPKTSFKSISSLVQSTSSVPSAVASSV